VLLEREDVIPDKPDGYGQTPLSRASFGGHEAVVRLLLARGDVNPVGPDNEGRTPLHVASMHGHKEIVALLQPRTSDL